MNYFEDQKIYVQGAEESWSYSTSGDVARFEVRAGDQWANDGGAPKQRSEVAASEKFEFGKTYEISFGLMIEPGAKNTAEWMSLMQIQSTFDKGEAGHSPAFAIEMVGEKMRIVTRDSVELISPINDGGYRRQYTDATDITRGAWYDFTIRVKLDPFGKGELEVYRNGVKLVDYDGPLGFNDLVGSYLKEGIYRETSDETIAVNYKGMTVTNVTDVPKVDPTAPPVNIPPVVTAPVVVAPVTPPTLDQADHSQDQAPVVSNPQADLLAAATVLRGDAGANTLTGGAGSDYFYGSAGKDVIKGGAGVDTVDYSSQTQAISVQLNGGSASVILAGAAKDTLSGIENIIGGSGADTIYGDNGKNQLFGGAGDDNIKSGGGGDFVDGGSGSDTIDYSGGAKAISVTLKGAADATVIWGGAALDTIRNVENVIGTHNNDTVIGDAADNSFYGQNGDDFFQGGGGSDFFEGSGGIDTASFEDKTASVVVTVNNNIRATVYVGGVAEDILSNVENVWGGQGADTLTGDTKANTFHGWGGADHLYGGYGADVLYGDDGNDFLDGGDQDDILIGGAGADVLTGGRQLDTFKFLAVTDSLPTGMDRITDFTQGDKIDISAIDANANLAGDQAFSLVKAFTGVAGQMTFAYADGMTTMQADVNGDGVADFGLLVNGHQTSTSGWLL